MEYDILFGLGGGFGGLQYQYTDTFDSYEEAEAAAYEGAVELYTSYEGANGIMSWEDCKEDWIESWPDEEPSEDDINERYAKEIESWIVYAALRKGC